MINSYQKLDPGAKLDNFQTPKGFMRRVAYAIDGRYNDEKTCLKTVRQYWKDATAALDQGNYQFHYEREQFSLLFFLKRQTYSFLFQFIEGPLQKEMNLPRQKRGRKYPSMSVFLIPGARLWGSDWPKYTS